MHIADQAAQANEPNVHQVATQILKLATLLYAQGLLSFKNEQPAHFAELLDAVSNGGIKIVLDVQPSKKITCIASTADGRKLPPFFEYQLTEKTPTRQRMN